MGLDNEEVEKRVWEFSEMVGLSEKELKKSPFDLSGGKRRRAAIAGVMAMKPEVLILDEPAAGLDPAGREKIFNAVENYRRKENATIIIVSHSMEDMALRCDDMIVLENGKIAASGTKDELFSCPEKLINAGLDVPEITRVAMIMSARGFDFGKPVYTVSDAADVLLPYLVKKGGEEL